jgi:hypothetical protein
MKPLDLSIMLLPAALLALFTALAINNANGVQNQTQACYVACTTDASCEACDVTNYQE